MGQIRTLAYHRQKNPVVLCELQNIIGKSHKVNGLYGIDRFSLKLALSSSYTPRRKLMKNIFVKVLILGTLLVSTTAALPMTQERFDGPLPYPCIPSPQQPNCN